MEGNRRCSIPITRDLADLATKSAHLRPDQSRSGLEGCTPDLESKFDWQIREIVEPRRKFTTSQSYVFLRYLNENLQRKIGRVVEVRE